CLVTPDQRPSARLRPGADRSGPVGPADDPVAAAKRVEALEQELLLTREVDALQFRADALANELFQVESTLQGAAGPEAALAEAEGALAGAPDPAALGLAADLAERLAQHPEQLQRREEALARLRAEREAEGLEEGEDLGAGAPPWAEPRFWGTVVATVAL